VSSHEGVSGSGRIVPVILKIRQEMEISGEGDVSTVLPLTERPCYPSGRALVGQHSWCGCFTKEINLFHLLEIESFHLFVVVLIDRLHTIIYLQLSAVGGVTDCEIRVSGAPPTANQIGGWVGSGTGPGILKKRKISYPHRYSNPSPSRP